MNVNIRIRDTVKGQKLSLQQLGDDLFEYTGFPVFRDAANYRRTNAIHQDINKLELVREQHDRRLHTVTCGSGTDWKSTMQPENFRQFVSIVHILISRAGKQHCRGHKVKSNYRPLEEHGIEIFRNVHALMIGIKIQEIPGNITKAPVTTSLIYERTTIDQHPVFLLGGAGHDSSGILQFQMVSKSDWMHFPSTRLQLSTKHFLGSAFLSTSNGSFSWISEP